MKVVGVINVLVVLEQWNLECTVHFIPFPMIRYVTGWTEEVSNLPLLQTLEDSEVQRTFTRQHIYISCMKCDSGQ